MKIFGVLGLIVLIIVLATVAVDVASTPKPKKGQCLLAKRILPPDVCVNSCTQVFDCTATTRPYAVFFTQAAICLDAVICE